MAKKKVKSIKKRLIKPFDYKRLVIAAIRKIWLWSPMRRNAIKKAEVQGGLRKCNICGKKELKENTQVDHVFPCVPTTGWDSWDGYIKRSLDPEVEVQVLCKPCHKQKSNKENATRKKKK